MATKAPTEEICGGGGQGQAACPEASDGWEEGPVLQERNSSPDTRHHRQRQDKAKQHVIMINKSGCQTVVSSGGGGHVQHVSVVGHVQQLGLGSDGASSILGSEADEIPSKRKEKSTSFKITNVYLSRPPSNDGEESGDDNEDLEDSHTEVTSVIINETAEHRIPLVECQCVRPLSYGTYIEF